MEYQNEIRRIKEEMKQLKIKHAKDVELNNQEEIQKNKQRVQDLVKRIEEIKVLRRKDETQQSNVNYNKSEINESDKSSNAVKTNNASVGSSDTNLNSNNTQASFNNNESTNSGLNKNSNSSVINTNNNSNVAVEKDQKVREYITPKVSSNKRFHTGTFAMALVLLIYSLICIFQRLFFVGTSILNQSGAINYNVIYFIHDFFKNTGIIILVAFVLYIIFVRRIRFRIPILILGIIGLVGGALSYNSTWSGLFYSGTGYGIFPGIILIICTVLVALNIKREPKKVL